MTAPSTGTARRPGRSTQLIQDNLGIDDSKWSKAVKDVTSFVIESSFGIWMPVPYTYRSGSHG